MRFTPGALVLEGGGLRGFFTSGVLRFFMDKYLYFSYVIGVSMGACNAANYVSRQPERNRIVNTRYLHDSRYISYLRLLMGGELFGMDFIFDTIPNQLVPFDFGTFYSSPVTLYTVATDCQTGDAVYMEKSELGTEYLNFLRASSSLPFLAKPVSFRGRLLMDGGLSDSIPIKKALKDGNETCVVVLTREKGYRKKIGSVPLAARFMYRHLPGILKALETRNRTYNETLEYLEELELQGKVFVIRPPDPIQTGRAERNKDKLYLTYDAGYEEAKRRWKELKEYLGENYPKFFEVE
ncbi:MAG: patatin family protein [Spirochaetes bacterium]|nr:patatin family protein [Spirochaetota bacterium]